MVELTGQSPRLPPPKVVAAKKSVRTWGRIVPFGAVSLIVVAAAIRVIVRFCTAVTILDDPQWVHPGPACSQSRATPLLLVPRR